MLFLFTSTACMHHMLGTSIEPPDYWEVCMQKMPTFAGGDW